MADILRITDLELTTHIGVPDKERASAQRLLVTVEMAIDAAKVSKDDDVTKGIDYGSVAHDLHELAKTERKTIERLAEDIATMILTEYRPQSVTVTVKKFVIPGTRDVSISILRKNPQ